MNIQSVLTQIQTQIQNALPTIISTGSSALSLGSSALSLGSSLASL
jgi:hypothetical protein